LPALQQGVVVGEVQEPLKVFVDQHNGLPVIAQGGQAAPNVLTVQGCQALGGLVQDQQVRVGHECAANGHHLLKASKPKEKQNPMDINAQSPDLTDPQ
jgi:hypothetical protein